MLLMQVIRCTRSTWTFTKFNIGKLGTETGDRREVIPILIIPNHYGQD